MAEHTLRAELQVAADHPCLPGHFPGRPLVPAVLLLQRVAEAAAPSLPACRLTRVARAKFLRPVTPDQVLVLSLSVDADRRRVRFNCSSGDKLVARGELHFVERRDAR
ncbi:MAG TPA: hypothetical protein VF265_05420 [Nevskiaceae bacterium]